jgi:2-oxoglutarate dehydrogenase E2 component (dihydrolipoamide succinyltransferase)
MSVDIVMPPVGESVTSGMIAAWIKNPGDVVGKDEAIVSVETDKATVDVPSPVAGKLKAVKFKVGAEVKIGDVLAEIEPGEQPAAKPPAAAVATVTKPLTAPAPSVTAPPNGTHAPAGLSPAVQRIVSEKGLDPAVIAGTGPAGRILKADVQDLPARAPSTPPPVRVPAAPQVPVTAPAPVVAEPLVITPSIPGARTERVVTTTPIRRTIARRLLEVTQNTAMLTTFNEVDMTQVQALRTEFQDAFQKKHGVKLGYMSFFIKACVDALHEFPIVNAELRGNDIVYKDYCDIGIAVGGGKGLVVPIIRNAETLSFATLEKVVADFGARAKDMKIKLEEMQGGTFSITNGGIYGSMMSTPILNPPQSAILGMHNIVKRAVVVNDAVVVRPMMYVAVSYDHRIIDGREAVSFLVRVKECLERPERVLLEA